MSQPEQPVVFISGAAQGLGAALLTQFSAAGFYVVASSRTPPALDARSGVEWKTLDIGQPGACEKVIGEVFDRLGRLDVVVSNGSGYLRGAALGELEEAEIAAEIDVTFRGGVYLARAFVRRAAPLKRGRIVFVASSAGLSHEAGCGDYAVYSASKAAVIRFAETLHDEISRKGMQSHVVIPGNMRDSSALASLIEEQAISYRAAAQAIVQIAQADGNLAMSRVELRPARVAGSSE